MSWGPRFPLRPQPLPEESLSSWIERLAAAMGVWVEDILVAGLAMPPLPADQLDYYPPPALITRLSERTNVPTEALWAMTVQRYVPLLLGRLDTPYRCRRADASPCWLFVPPQEHEPQHGPPRVAWQDSVQRCGRMCPMCLYHEAPPYRRLAWRLSWTGSCPHHGVVLEERPHGNGGREDAAHQPVTAGHLDLLFLDRLTLQAITSGVVVLPNRRRLPGGRWLRIVRALIDELCLTRKDAKQARATLRVFWMRPTLGYRGGVLLPTPFEMHQLDRQRLFLTVAGTAIRMLCEGRVVSPSPWATLLAPSGPQGARRARLLPDGGYRARLRDVSAQLTLGDLLQQWLALCQADPERATHMHQWLRAGYQRYSYPPGEVDDVSTENGTR